MGASSNITTMRYEIEAAPRSLVGRCLDSLGALNRPSTPTPSAYHPTRGPAECFRFHITDNAPLGPIHLSCGFNAVFLYAARYKNGELGVLGLVGQCLRPLIDTGNLPDEYQALLGRTDYCGEIVSHTLTEVVTPTSTSSIVDRVISFENKTHLQSFFRTQASHSLPVDAPLRLLRLELLGYSLAHPPTCTLSSTGRERDLLLTIGRSVDDEHARVLNVSNACSISPNTKYF